MKVKTAATNGMDDARISSRRSCSVYSSHNSMCFTYIMSKRWAHVVDSNASSLSVWVAVRLPVTFCCECYGLWLLYYYCCLVHCIEMQCTWCWSNGSFSAGQQHAIVIWQQNWRKPRVFWIIFFFFLSVFKAPDIHESTNTEWTKKKRLWRDYWRNASVAMPWMDVF